MKRSCNTNLSRRDALKLLGVASGTLLLPVQSAAKTTLSMSSSHKEADIVILGAGSAGVTVASRLRRAAPKAKITIVAPNIIHLYQSGQVYAAAGVYQQYDNRRNTADLLPSNITWLQEKVQYIDPDNNRVITEKSGTLTYDYLITALGCEYNFESIKGVKAEDIGKNGITSVYLNNLEEGTAKGAYASKGWLQSIRREAAKSSNRLAVLFAESDTAIKGENAPLDMLFLCNDMLKGHGVKKGNDVHEKVTFTFAKSSSNLFRIPATNKSLSTLVQKEKNINPLYHYTLTAIDVIQKFATFDYQGSTVQMGYDFLHITPPMQPPKVLRDSPLAIQNGKHQGWMQIDPHTLQHPKYKNVFGIGDVLGLKTGKSSGAIRGQAIVIQDNLAAQMENLKLPLHYNGYSVAPIKTEYGKILLAEYTYRGLKATIPLDLTKTQWLWWAIDVHVIRRAYFDLMLRGMM